MFSNVRETQSSEPIFEHERNQCYILYDKSDTQLNRFDMFKKNNNINRQALMN